MLDTLLDVGCTPAAVRGLMRMTGNPRFAWDCRRRFLESYGQIVLGLDSARFAARLADLVTHEGVENDRALDSEALERLAMLHHAAIEEHDDGLPDDPFEQLARAARAVYGSWMSERASTYRRLQHLEDLRGTAVTVQAMVYGNNGLSSGAGVAFSRDPSTGIAQPVIDVLFDAQGEEVVSGRRTPETEDAIERSLPSIGRELREILRRLEREFRDVQDIEFTIEEGRLWILQARSAKRTPRASLRIAIDLVQEGLFTKQEAIERVSNLDPAALTRTRLLDAGRPAGRGIGASSGIAVGRAAFDSEGAKRLAAGGEAVILMRPDISTADVAGFAVSAGIVAAVGGRTAHAALVARQLARPCVVGCSDLTIDVAGGRATLAGSVITNGDWITVDGDNGGIYLGRREIIIERPEAELAEIARWRATGSRSCGTAAKITPALHQPVACHDDAVAMSDRERQAE
jgi:pyruvate,orthophosphate dikinase